MRKLFTILSFLLLPACSISITHASNAREIGPLPAIAPLPGSSVQPWLSVMDNTTIADYIVVQGEGRTWKLHFGQGVDYVFTNVVFDGQPYPTHFTAWGYKIVPTSPTDSSKRVVLVGMRCLGFTAVARDRPRQWSIGEFNRPNTAFTCDYPTSQ